MGSAPMGPSANVMSVGRDNLLVLPLSRYSPECQDEPLFQYSPFVRNQDLSERTQELMSTIQETPNRGAPLSPHESSTRAEGRVRQGDAAWSGPPGRGACRRPRPGLLRRASGGSPDAPGASPGDPEDEAGATVVQRELRG